MIRAPKRLWDELTDDRRADYRVVAEHDDWIELELAPKAEPSEQR